MESKQFTLNQLDYSRIIRNGIIFMAPALLVLLASVRDIIPQEGSTAVIALFVLNVATDIIRKFVQGK